MSNSVARMGEALSVVESATPYKPPPSDAFDRTPDPTIVRLHAAANLSMDAVPSSIQSTINEMRRQKDAFATEGETIGKFFVLKLGGADQLAAARASKCLQLQKTSRTWKDVCGTTNLHRRGQRRPADEGRDYDEEVGGSFAAGPPELVLFSGTSPRYSQY